MFIVSFNLIGFGKIEEQKINVVRIKKSKSHYEVAGTFIDISEEHRETLAKFFKYCETWSFE